MNTETEVPTAVKKPRGRPPVKNPEKLAQYKAAWEAYNQANPQTVVSVKE